MTPDIINGTFEAVGSIFLWLNCWRLWQDKMVRGYSALTTLFFSSWGFWNLFYYPHLEQWWSFAGGVSIVTANTVWLAMMIYYRKN